jgi:hypothetical protein
MHQARYARLTGAATHPAGARPSKCIIIIVKVGVGQAPYPIQYRPLAHSPLKGRDGRPRDMYWESIGVVRIQDQVTPRTLEYWQFPTLSRWSSTVRCESRHI